MINVSNEELISIVIPSYNRENTITRAISSVRNQTYRNLEIIVVDDCSTDNSIKVIKELQKKDTRIKLLKNEQNQGANYTRNRGIKASRGKYVSLIDSDDEWLPETIEILYKKILQTPEQVGLVYPGMNMITETTKREILPKYRGKVFRKLLTQGTIGGYPLIKKKIFETTGLFDEHEILRKGGAQDYEMWIRIARFYEFEYVNIALLNAYFQNDSVTFKSTVKHPFRKINTYLYIWNKFHPYFGDDKDIYVFFCYKIFELLLGANLKQLAKKIIFMAFKSQPYRFRTYYHLLFYLDHFYLPGNLMEWFQIFARNIKEQILRFKFRFKH